MNQCLINMKILTFKNFMKKYNLKNNNERISTTESL